MEDCWLISFAFATGLTAAEAEAVSFAKLNLEVCLECPGAVPPGFACVGK